MQTNHYTEIGADHKVCQDYAASGFLYNVERGPTYYAIVCDGCSSAPHSEFGAQVLTHAAISELKCNPYIVPEDFLRELMYKAKESVMMLGVNPRCLFSTLLVARADDKGTHVWMWGDGVYGLVLKNGVRYTVKTHYAGNAPYYPYYATTRSERDRYLSEFNCVKEVTTCIDGDVSEKTWTGNDAFLVTGQWLPTELLQSVTLMSDGVESFQTLNKESVPYIDVVTECTGYKTTAGEFVERRMKAFKRKWVADSWSHYDDVGVAGVTL